MIPWVFAQTFGTLETIFLTVVTLQISIKVFLIIFLELMSIYEIFILCMKIAKEKKNSLSYEEFKKGLENSPKKHSKLRFQYNRAILMHD